MPTIVVDVMPKAELLDPQGKAVPAPSPGSAWTQFSSVRIGKRFELTVDGEVDDDVLADGPRDRRRDPLQLGDRGRRRRRGVE